MNCHVFIKGVDHKRATNDLETCIGSVDASLRLADGKLVSSVQEMLDNDGLYPGMSSTLNAVAAFEMARRLGPGMQIKLLCLMSGGGDGLVSISRPHHRHNTL